MEKPCFKKREFCFCLYLSAPYVYSAHRGRKKTLIPLELELQVVVSRHVGAEDRPDLEEQPVQITSLACTQWVCVHDHRCPWRPAASDLPGAGAVDAVVPVLAAEPSLQPPLLPSSHIVRQGLALSILCSTRWP